MQKSHVVVDQYMYVFWTPSSVCLFQIPTVTNEGCHFMLLYIEKKAHTFFELCYHVPKVNKKPIRNCSHTYSFIIELFISRIIVIESVYGLNSLVNTFIWVQYCTGCSNFKLSKVNGCRTETKCLLPYNVHAKAKSTPFQLCSDLLLRIFNRNTL